jgi:hypothetical protein
MSRTSSRRPPPPQINLTIGVTGHREIAVGERAHIEAETARIIAWLASDRHATREIRLLSQLAAGADQLFAAVALDHGARLQVVLPFAHDTYAVSLPDDARAGFQRLSERAASTWIAPIVEGDADAAYHLAGIVMLAQSDLLIALWDGKPGRGIGGTAYVVAQAVREGLPVIHIHPDGSPTRVLWSQFDHLDSHRLDPSDAPQRPCDDAALEQIAARLLGPPTAADQKRGLGDFLAERERHLRLRFEYPLLLALTGVRRLSWSHVFSGAYHKSTHTEWAEYRDALSELGVDSQARFGLLQSAYSWSDRLADHYAQIYRSGTILNYGAAATSVLAALASVLVPQMKPALLAVELISLAALILNTTVGNRRQWHRRWLDYRYLAEQLRPMRSLKLMGAFGPRPGAGAQAAASVSWTDWYAANIWRQLDLPPQVHGAAETERLVSSVVTHEFEPQIAYHELNAARMATLDHRLHQAGTVLFVASLICCLIGLLGFLPGVQMIKSLEKLLTVLSAALPTLGAAVFGIRGQSDFAGAARRSSETAKRLRRTVEQMQLLPPSLSKAARLTEDAAQTMAADLGEWRTAFLERKIAIPA